MNKTFWTLSAAGIIMIGSVMGANINGDFKKLKGALPDGWQQNQEEWAKPFGTVTVDKSGDKNTVTVKSQTKATQLFTVNSIPGEAEDEFIITVKAQGKGKGFVGIMSYDAHDRWLASDMQPIAFSGEKEVFRKTFSVQDHDGKMTKKIRVAFGAGAEAEVIFEEIKIELTEE